MVDWFSVDQIIFLDKVNRLLKLVVDEQHRLHPTWTSVQCVCYSPGCQVQFWSGTKPGNLQRDTSCDIRHAVQGVFTAEMQIFGSVPHPVFISVIFSSELKSRSFVLSLTKHARLLLW